jgi:tRNA A-37 threonylcarbamoyl transferase component Bud32
MPDPLIGQRLERYEVQELLGEGGMGSVYRAQDTVLKRAVALKLMHPQYARKVEFQQRFLNEAQVAAQLDHRGIVKVYDYRQDDDRLYIVMEYIAGGNLSEMLAQLRSRQQWFSLREAVQLVREVAVALSYAHGKGVLHRDIKPANIMIKAGAAGDLPYQPVITDLGLARLGEGLGLTQAGTSMGTPAYMSPEQALGKPLDARSDVYSLGILLYELAVGQLPFAVKSLSEAMRVHPVEAPPRPTDLRPDLPSALEQIILRTLRKEPDARYQSAASLAADLGRQEPAQLSAAPPPSAVAGAAAVMTVYQQSLVRPRGQSLVEEFPPVAAAVDSIQILGPDGRSRTAPITTKIVTIGRAGDNTLVLVDAKVSQHHLRIEREDGRYRVIDQKSTNGTYLGGVRLLPGVPQTWDPQKPLQLGGHSLLLLLAAAASTTGTATTIDDQGLPPADGAAFLQVVRPGEAVSLPCTLYNQSQQVDAITLRLEGVPPAWVTTPPPSDLYPDARQETTITVRPPAAPDSRAGDYPLRIFAESRNSRRKTLLQTLTLRILPYQRVTSMLNPMRIKSRQTAGVILENLGNAPQEFILTWSDPDNQLVFDPTNTTVKIEAGQRITVPYSARLRRRPWFGGSIPHPIAVNVAAAGDETVVHQATFTGAALLPRWLPILLLLLLAAIGTFIFNQLNDMRARAAADVAATATIAMLRDSDGDELPDVTETQTDPQKSDTDDDGLNDKQELENKTDPNNPDTDGDGLGDGDEVKWQTNPLAIDSDGDTLWDGDEVRRGISPVNPNTDGDAWPDNVDPDPSNPPTPTRTPDGAATAAAIAILTNEATYASATAAQATSNAVAATNQEAARIREADERRQQEMLNAALTQNALAAEAAAAAAAAAAAPPTDTPTPVFVAPEPQPLPVPVPVTATSYVGTAFTDCSESYDRVRFEGYVYAGGLPQNGVSVSFNSRLGSDTWTEVTGPSERRPEWSDGYYEHIVDANVSGKGKRLQIWLQNDAGEDISNRVFWDTSGNTGTCNYARIDFILP